MIITADSIKASGIDPKSCLMSNDGKTTVITLGYADKQQAVAALREFLEMINMDCLRVSDIRLKCEDGKYVIEEREFQTQ